MQLDTIPVIRSSMLAQFPRLVHGMSTVQGADAPDAEFSFNPDVRAIGRDPHATDHVTRFMARFGMKPTQLAVMQQVHGASVHEVTAAGMVAGTDALVTHEPRLALGVRVADCVPVLLYAPSEDVIAAVHAGWRGGAEHITTATITHMCRQHRVEPEDILAWLGPSAGPCCYDVGDEVAERFDEAHLIRREGRKTRLDLRAALRRELKDIGVPVANIEVDGLCTICHPALLHSHRRDGESAGRMMAIIALRETLE